MNVYAEKIFRCLSLASLGICFNLAILYTQADLPQEKAHVSEVAQVEMLEVEPVEIMISMID